MDLVTDRTLVDVQQRNAKGTYNATDLNRVEAAVGELSEDLLDALDTVDQYAADKGIATDDVFRLPYQAGDITVTTKTDWAMTDIPTQSEMGRYLSNVRAVAGALESPHPPLPDGMFRLTYEGANNIERSLELVEPALEDAVARIRDRIDRTAQALLYSGDVYAGEI